jgi:RimJ/RimL family protein N-acetyltransferase
MRELKSLRLVLRPIEIGDNADIFKYRADAQTNKYQGWIPKTIEDVDEFIAKNPAKFNLPETWFQLVIIEKESEKLIGDVGVHFFGEENMQVELGCTLDANFQRKGYATEALTAIIDFLFNELKKHRIIGSVDPRNKPSLAMMDRLGFRKEAHFKKSLYINGEWVDDVIYALLKSDWKS